MLFALVRFVMGNRRLRIISVAGVLFVIVLTVSSLGIWYIESEQNISLLDSVWLSVVTMTTTGYGDIAPKTTAGKIFTIFVPMLMGIGTMAYLVTMIATSIIEKEARIMNGQMDLSCEGHILIFNMQREEKIHTLLDELRKDHKSSEVPIVLIDSELEKCPDRLLQRKNFYWVKGNPLWSATLERANAAKAAHAVILAKDPKHSASDGVTLQIAIVLKHMHQELGTNISVVAEVVSDDSVGPLQHAGVTQIICLETLIPPLLANALTRNINGG